VGGEEVPVQECQGWQSSREAKAVPYGNRMRPRPPSFAIKEDEAWKSDMSGVCRRPVEALSWPLRLRYGYSSAAILPRNPTTSAKFCNRSLGWPLL
jgi:hypothetical protein